MTAGTAVAAGSVIDLSVVVVVVVVSTIFVVVVVLELSLPQSVKLFVTVDLNVLHAVSAVKLAALKRTLVLLVAAQVANFFIPLVGRKLTDQKESKAHACGGIVIWMKYENALAQPIQSNLFHAAFIRFFMGKTLKARPKNSFFSFLSN